MGSQVSTMKNVIVRKRKGTGKSEKAKIGILSFEVANVMTKLMQLWQSLSDIEILRLRTGAIKAEGVRNLVSDNDAVLLSLACMEKLQDLTAVAGSVARLGKRCQDPLLQGFEHIYNDVLKHKIDMRTWEYSRKSMEAKVKKMQQFIASTSSLYEELEILGNVEMEIQRVMDYTSGMSPDRDRLLDMEEKASFHRQEIKYLRELSLWNCTCDKIGSLLAQTVYTIHGRISFVFGSPLLGLPQLFPVERLRDTQASRQKMGVRLTVTQRRSSDLQRRSSELRRSLELSSPNGSIVVTPFNSSSPSRDRKSMNGAATNSASSSTYVTSRLSSIASEKRPPLRSNNSIAPYTHPHPCYFSVYQACLYTPSKNSLDFQALGLDSPDPIGISTKVGAGNQKSSFADTLVNSPTLRSTPKYGQKAPCRIPSISPGHDLFNQTCYTTKVFFDPKNRHHNAPSTTLGGAALAQHYSNIVIIIDKMIKFPHFISQESRDNLYHMLPKSVQMAVKSRLKAGMRKGDGFDADIARDWKNALERILAWLTPLAHNMSRWQSEHNFEQQQVLQRSNILLFQTLYFADLAKTEAAITELLVGLNYIYGYEKEKTDSDEMDYDYDSQHEEDDYPEWQY
ncbi:unnamed protein product [Calypogeia fissa]